jgi:cellulose synthase/poly-beta-1,6-N-acetylglucosamine synthase-like glycosyltransferase
MSILFYILLACACIQLVYYLVFFLRLSFVRGFRSLPESLPPASIIICAKNEAANLVQNLKIVLIQQYPQFEVIVVNDQSTDNTIDVLVDYYKRNKNMKLVNIAAGESKNLPGKKYALMKGIEMASFETIVVTDADCRPATTHWLAKMVGTYLYETKIVLGFSPYEKCPGFLNRLIRYENFMTAMQYFGLALAGLPYMGVGRNLSYKKELFKNFSFNTNDSTLTGDDDLLVNAVATGKNTEVCIDKDAFMYTRPAATFKEWLNQKRRHLRSGFKYKLHHKLLLFLFAASNFIFYACFIILLLQVAFLKWALLAFLITAMLRFVITFRAYKKLGSGDLKWLSPFLDVVYCGYLLLIFLLLLLKPKDTWRT